MHLSISKIAFIVDIRGWAFDNIAQTLQRSFLPTTEITLYYWDDYIRFSDLIEELAANQYQLVHFFFREHLNLIINTVDLQRKAADYLCDIVITTHIPDYLYSSDSELMERHHLFNFCDGYFTINQDLKNLYSSQSFIPAPWGMIYDRLVLESATNLADSKGRDQITAYWCGNSQWGQYAGLNDYKGLQSIIKPVISQLQQHYPRLNFVIHDSSVKQYANATILAALAKADILLIASEKEGTPLSLIEAMAQNCAIVSTRVGIAPEVLPEIQQQFLCERSPEAFYKALKVLLDEPAILQQCQRENRAAYQREFGTDSKIAGQWLSFFNDAIAKHHEDGSKRKRALLACVGSDYWQRKLVTAMRAGARLAKKSGMVPVLNRLSPVFAATYHRVMHGSSKAQVNYSLAGQIYQQLFTQLEISKPLVIYSPKWKGVAASTSAIFGNNAVRFPFFEAEYPETEDHHYLDTIAQLIISSQVRTVIYSGGSRMHLSLARIVHGLNPAIRQFFLWHGSPAQWVDERQLSFFKDWQQAYDTGTIGGMITLKSGLHYSLDKLGIQAFELSNPLPELVPQKTGKAANDNSLHVGLFSAVNSWYKNPLVQLLAIAGKNITLNTNLERRQVEEFSLKTAAIHYYPPMERRYFLQLLGRQDLNLYVTNTECSPMTVLESWALDVPCIVGPAGDVYSAINERLAAFLVEPRVDDPNALSDRIDYVIENRVEIVGLLQESKARYRQYYADQLRRLLHNLSLTDWP